MRIAPYQCVCGVALMCVALAGQAQSDHTGHGGHGGHAVESAPVAAPAATPAASGHAGHDMPMSDEHAGHSMPATTSGSWSYIGRDNPKPTTESRWEMLPVPEYGHMFISAEGHDPALRCRALAAPSVMVDRATRAACELDVQPGSAQ